MCPPSLVSGNQWRKNNGYVTGAEAPEEYADSPTDLEGDPDPECLSEEFVYTEKREYSKARSYKLACSHNLSFAVIYLPHSYFVTDHKQAWREDSSQGLFPGDVPLVGDGSPQAVWAIEEDTRWRMRRALFPRIREDTFIFANWNQLYKIDPFVFNIWLNILTRHSNSILWLLRFPSPGEAKIKQMATLWAGPEVAERIIFTDVAVKSEHIHRGRIADLFLDTTEVSAHLLSLANSAC